jgi:hypothetical protein
VRPGSKGKSILIRSARIGLLQAGVAVVPGFHEGDGRKPEAIRVPTTRTFGGPQLLGAAFARLRLPFALRDLAVGSSASASRAASMSRLRVRRPSERSRRWRSASD